MTIESFFTIKVCRLWVFILMAILPALSLAQAGSSLPVFYEDADAFYNSLPLGFGSSSGAMPSAKRVLPQQVLKLPDDQPYLFWVELRHGRLKVLERQSDGGMIVRLVLPVSIGANGYGKSVEGDKRTPLGVYQFTSFLADEQLIDYYGLGAYPMDYPNSIDRRLGKTGSGIWLHGLPKDVDQRPLMDSDGCVVIDNESLLAMERYIDIGRTYIVLTEDALNWIPMEESEARRRSLEQAFENWRLAWESGNNDDYLSFYAEDFSDSKRSMTQWSSYKRRVNDSKSYIDVDVSKLSLIADPLRPDVVIVRYFQQYRSSNHNWTGWKEQLWRERDEQWEIIYEGNT